MSTPVNPLDKFRSYSYHHILLMAGSTEAIRKLTSNELSGNDLSDYTGLKLGVAAGDENSPYYMVCDTRKNSFFSISSVNYTSYVTGVSKTAHTGVIVGDLDMKLVDATGIGLINYLQYISTEKLKISIQNVTFFLKTIFVGHTDSGTVETVTQTGIPMMLYDMTVFPNHEGSTIHAKFVPLSNSAAISDKNYARMNDIPGVFSPTKKLKDAVKSLENAINAKSRTWYKELQLKKVADTSAPSGGKSYGKLVQYMFTLPKEWEAFEVSGVYDKVSETKFKKDGKKEPNNTSGVYVAFSSSAETTVTEMLNTMLRQSKNVQDLAGNENKVKGEIQAFEIHTQVTSDNDSITVHYDVIGLAIPKSVPKSTGEEMAKDAQTSNFTKVGKENIMEFDYIFSGKNTDILNFEMKLNRPNVAMADNVFLGGAAQAEASKDQSDKEKDKTETVKKEQYVVNFHEKDAVTLPAKTSSQMRNMPWVFETDDKKGLIKSRQQFIDNISTYCGMSTIDAIVKIRGNPSLFSRFLGFDAFTHVKIPDNLSTSYVSNDKAFVEGVGANKVFLLDSDVKKYLDEKEKATEKKYGASVALPFYVKINVFGTDYDFSSGDVEAELKKSMGPYTQLWFKGHYFVRTISHHFDNGDFTQEILLGTPLYDEYDKKANEETAAKRTAN